MKLSTLIAAVAALTAATFFAACEDNEANPVAPEFGELVLSKTTCEPSDSIYAIMKVKTEGAYYYYFRLYYTINGVQQVVEKSDLKTPKGDAAFAFRAPSKAGKFNVSAHATVSFTANGQLYGDTNTVSSTLEVVEPKEDTEGTETE